MRFHLMVFLVALPLLLGTGGSLVLARSGALPGPMVDAVDRILGGPPAATGAARHVIVKPGEDAATIGNQLVQDGLVRSALAFRVVVRSRGLAPHLRAGDYELRPTMSLDEVISILTAGRMSGGLLTIPEGWRALQIADALAQGKVVGRQDFLQAVHSGAVTLPASLGAFPSHGSVEGFLFPDSYRFEPNTPAPAVVQRMVDDFDRHLTPDLRAGFAANGLGVAQAVTLASIVEREAVVADERPTIASVYLNRLRRGMKLQADPTVQYALVQPNARPSPDGYWKTRLTFADLAVASPYNTYQVVGLPPGPICNPGLASLEAVAHPASTDYLYFVARPDHTHAFSRTYQEQVRNVAKYAP